MAKFGKMFKGRRSCEDVLQECERNLRLQRCSRKELRKELEQEKVKWLGTIDWTELNA